jgi:hypothetical protein
MTVLEDEYGCRLGVDGLLLWTIKIRILLHIISPAPDGGIEVPRIRIGCGAVIRRVLFNFRRIVCGVWNVRRLNYANREIRIFAAVLMDGIRGMPGSRPKEVRTASSEKRPIFTVTAGGEGGHAWRGDVVKSVTSAETN